MADKVFVDGLRVEKPDAKAPTWVIAKVTIKVDEFMDSAIKIVGSQGVLTLDIKQSQKGGYYAEVNQWKPMEKPAFVKEAEAKIKEQAETSDAIEYPSEEINAEEIPF